MKRVNTLLWVAAVFLFLTTGCTASRNNMGSHSAPTLHSPGVGSGEVYFTYPLGETLNVKVTFENREACDAVEMGLYLLRQTNGEDEEEVPFVEDQAFFPKYLVMINVDISDGLLLISENEAKHFAHAKYLEYQKKVVPSDYLPSKHQRRLLEDIKVPKTDKET